MSFFTTANFMRWEFWTIYDPANGLFGNQKCAFDGPNKIIYVKPEGVTNLNVKDDIYSDGKSGYEETKKQKQVSSATALTAIGGEPLNDTLNVGSTFFLENGWRIQPFPSSRPYILTVNGKHLYTRGRWKPFSLCGGCVS